MIVYFDTSAFVKMFLDEPGTRLARLAWDTAPSAATSLLLFPEARSALARARHLGRSVSVAADRTEGAIDARMNGMHVVTPTYRLVHEAGVYADTRLLRGFDSVHLASAKQTGPETVLVTGDKRLADAARAEGMVVVLAA